MRKRISFAIIFAVALLAGLAAAPVYGGGGEDGLARADQARQRHTDALMAKPGVVGVALGLNPAGHGSVLVLTTEPGVAEIPGQLDGVPVHVMVTGEIFALHHCKGKHAEDPSCQTDPPPDPEPPTTCATTERCARPVPIGVSTGHPSITAGTIGARVTNGTDVYALSNNHVYADENLASIGDAVIQPGTFDGGSSPADDIGTLHAFAAIDFTGGDNTIDAAIALSSTGDLSNATPPDGYGTPKSITIAAAINMRVKKYGRTTGQTKGRVTAINATVDVGYSTGVARFVNQIIIGPGDFSAGGDSGSLIVADGKGRNKADDGKPVGLLFAGSAFATIANPIDAVLTRFSVSIDGE